MFEPGIWTRDSESTACVITDGRTCIFSRCALSLRHAPAQTHHKTFIKQSHCKMTSGGRRLSMLPTNTTSRCDRAVTLTVPWFDAKHGRRECKKFKVVGSFNLTAQKKNGDARKMLPCGDDQAHSHHHKTTNTLEGIYCARTQPAASRLDSYSVK